jgi:hypothetical protein
LFVLRNASLSLIRSAFLFVIPQRNGGICFCFLIFTILPDEEIVISTEAAQSKNLRHTYRCLFPTN